MNSNDFTIDEHASRPQQRRRRKPQAHPPTKHRKNRGHGAYRMVYPKLWKERRFRGLGDIGQRVCLCLLSEPQTNRIGYYALSLGELADDIDIERAPAKEAVAAVCSAFGWRYDDDARTFLIPSWFDYNMPANPDHLKSQLDDVATVPPGPLDEAFLKAAIAQLDGEDKAGRLNAPVTVLRDRHAGRFRALSNGHVC